MILSKPRSRHNLFILILLWVGCYTSGYAQQFDQSYEKWKAQQQARDQQLLLLDDLGTALDKYMRSFIMHTAFKMCKGTANKYHFELMYDFIGEGFVAMKPMKSAAKFIHEFTVKEREIVEKVHSGQVNPFV